jgi:hypothetical protein
MNIQLGIFQIKSERSDWLKKLKLQLSRILFSLDIKMVRSDEVMSDYL